jgi:hypothetical protein
MMQVASPELDSREQTCIVQTWLKSAQLLGFEVEFANQRNKIKSLFCKPCI